MTIVKALRVSETGETSVVEFDNHNALATLQEAVGGMIEGIYFDYVKTYAYVNEEGLYTRTYNPFGTFLMQKAYGAAAQQINGPILFTGPTDGHGYTLSLPDAESEALVAMVAKVKDAYPEPFAVAEFELDMAGLL